MRFLIATSLLAAAQLALGPGGATAGEGVKPKAVVELFTSQGCSSCPAADRLFAKLSYNQDLIVLSMNVDYWDYIGWKDTLAQPMFTTRQKAYALARGDRQVYTPQAVINGRLHVVGSQKYEILNAIEKSRQEDIVLSLPVTLTNLAGRIAIDVKPSEQQAEIAGPAEIWAFSVQREVTVPIERGENAGQTVTYHNVVRKAVKVGDLKFDRTEPLTLDPAAIAPEADAVIVLVQGIKAAGPGAIYGAAEIGLR